MEFLLNGPLTEPCVNTFQSKESSEQQSSTDEYTGRCPGKWSGGSSEYEPAHRFAFIAQKHLLPLVFCIWRAPELKRTIREHRFHRENRKRSEKPLLPFFILVSHICSVFWTLFRKEKGFYSEQVMQFSAMYYLETLLKTQPHSFNFLLTLFGLLPGEWWWVTKVRQVASENLFSLGRWQIVRNLLETLSGPCCKSATEFHSQSLTLPRALENMASVSFLISWNAWQ